MVELTKENWNDYVKLDVIKEESYNGFGELVASYERTQWALGEADDSIYAISDALAIEIKNTDNGKTGIIGRYLGDAYIGIDDYTMTDQVPYECLRAKGTIYIIENLPDDIVYVDENISYINVGEEGDYKTIRWRTYADGRQVTDAEFIESLY